MQEDRAFAVPGLNFFFHDRTIGSLALERESRRKTYDCQGSAYEREPLQEAAQSMIACTGTSYRVGSASVKIVSLHTDPVRVH